MCFRVETAQEKKVRGIAGIKFGYEDIETDLFGKSVFPGGAVPIISQKKDGASNTIYPASYRLIPHWVTDPDSKESKKRFFVYYNTRSEDVMGSRAFKTYFLGSRCLVPLQAFYEYSGSRGTEGRLVYRSSIEDESIMMAAGIFSVINDPAGGYRPTFSIMTRDPNERVKNLYERTPVILQEKYWEMWLDRNFKDGKALQDVCLPWDHEKLVVQLIPKIGDPETVVAPAKKTSKKK